MLATLPDLAELRAKAKLPLQSRRLPEVQTSIGRLYVLSDGSPVPSVTTINKIIDQPHLRVFRAKHGEEEADRIVAQAVAIGNRFHHWAERYNLCLAAKIAEPDEWKPDPSDAILYGMAGCYRRWCVQCNLRIIGAECTLYSARYKFAGTPDFVARADLDIYNLGRDVVTLGDYKTSAYTGELWPLQTAGYQLMVDDALSELAGVRPGLGLDQDTQWVAARMVLRLDKDKPGEMAVLPQLDHKVDRYGFLGALHLWHWRYRERIKRIRRDIERGKLVPTIRDESEEDE